MKPFLISFLLILTVGIDVHAQYDAQIKSITQELSKKIAESGKRKIAVADFTDADGTVTKLGQFISEEFNTYLPEAGQGFEVIDRTRIKTLMRENQLLRKGLTDPSAAAQLGKMAGIEALIYGSITPFGENVRVNIKISDIQRGVILRSLVGNITRTADINRLLGESIGNNGGGDYTDIEDNNPGGNVGKDTDKNCAVNHTGTLCFQNQTKKDIRIYTAGIDITIHPGQTECQEGMKTYGKGEYTYSVYIYKDNRESQRESRQVIVAECQKKTLVVR